MWLCLSYLVNALDIRNILYLWPPILHTLHLWVIKKNYCSLKLNVKSSSPSISTSSTATFTASSWSFGCLSKTNATHCCMATQEFNQDKSQWCSVAVFLVAYVARPLVRWDIKVRWWACLSHQFHKQTWFSIQCVLEGFRMAYSGVGWRHSRLCTG